MIEEFSEKLMEVLSMEFSGAIKCHRVSFSSCQTFLPPAVPQHGLICLQFALYLAPSYVRDITSFLAAHEWVVTLNTLDRLLIGPLLHFPSCRSAAVPRGGCPTRVFVKVQLVFTGGLLFFLRPMGSSWLMTGSGCCALLTHTPTLADFSIRSSVAGGVIHSASLWCFITA